MKKNKDTQLAFYDRKKEEKKKLLDRFRDPRDPLKSLIVTPKLLAGVDAPILQATFLDKPMKEHKLLQAICCTNTHIEIKVSALTQLLNEAGIHLLQRGEIINE